MILHVVFHVMSRKTHISHMPSEASKDVGTCTCPAAIGWQPTTRSSQKTKARRYSSFARHREEELWTKLHRQRQRPIELECSRHVVTSITARSRIFTVGIHVVSLGSFEESLAGFCTAFKASARSPVDEMQFWKLLTFVVAPATHDVGKRDVGDGKPTKFHMRMVSGVESFSFFTAAEYCRKS